MEGWGFITDPQRTWGSMVSAPWWAGYSELSSHQWSNFMFPMRLVKRFTNPHAMLVHEERCPLTVTVWPLDAKDDHDSCRSMIRQMCAACSCEPLVMYTGARA